jgi:hypothetical protein
MSKKLRTDEPQTSIVEPVTSAATTDAKPPAASYEVGYGRPPTSTQWQPKQSGNDKGRPKRSSRGKSSMAQAALEQKVKIEKAGKTHKASVRQAAFERIAEKALSGDMKSVSFLLAREIEEQPPPNLWAVAPETALEILRAYFAREKTKKGDKS